MPTQQGHTCSGASDHNATTPTNTATLSISELLDKGRITDTTGLNKQEVDILL